MMNCLAVGLGGFAGAVLRYLIGLIPTGETMIFPVKTFCINVIGCIVIGAITVLAAKLSVPPRMILFLKVGVCGGFTTFSTFALESSDLIRVRNTLCAVACFLKYFQRNLINQFYCPFGGIFNSQINSP